MRKLSLFLLLFVSSTSAFAQSDARALGNTVGRLLVIVLVIFLIYKFFIRKKRG
jgi:hypothetical protein